MYVESFANLSPKWPLPISLVTMSCHSICPDVFLHFLIVTKPFSTSLPEQCDADSSTSLLEEKSRRLLKTVVI